MRTSKLFHVLVLTAGALGTACASETTDPTPAPTEQSTGNDPAPAKDATGKETAAASNDTKPAADEGAKTPPSKPASSDSGSGAHFW